MLFRNLSLDRVCRVPHFVRNSGVDQREKTLLADSHFIKNFLRNVNHLNDFMIAKIGLNFLSVDLDIFEDIISLVTLINDFVNIINS